MMRYRIWIAILFISIVMGSSLYAQGGAAADLMFLGQELGVGARAMSMGGAFVGVADDYTAMYWNPAGLGLLTKTELNVGFTHNKVENDVLFLDETHSGDQTSTKLNSIGFAFPLPTQRGSMVVGLGYNKFKDYDHVRKFEGFNPSYAAFQDFVAPYFENDFGTNTVTSDVYQTITEMEEGDLHSFTLSGAFEAQKDLMVGASVSFIGGNDDFSKRLREEDSRNLHNFIADSILSDLDYWKMTLTQETDIEATQFKIGALYRIGDHGRLGLMITPATTYRHKIYFTEDQEEIFLDDDFELEPAVYESEYEYEYQEPFELALGGAFSVARITLSGQVEFKDWSQAKFKDDPYEDVSREDANLFISDSLRSVWSYSIGGEVLLPGLNSRLRAGYRVKPSPFENSEGYPELKYWSVGGSISLGPQTRLDLAYIRGSWDENRFDPLSQLVTEESKTWTRVVGTLAISY